MDINIIIFDWLEKDLSGFWMEETKNITRSISRGEVPVENPKESAIALLSLFLSTELIDKIPLSGKSVYFELLLVAMKMIDWNQVAKLYLEKHEFFGLSVP